MSNYCITFSPTGGTEKVSRILAQNIMEGYIEIDLCSDIHPVKLNSDDICIFAVPSYGGRVPTVAVERIKRISSDGAKAILVCVYGNRQWDDTLTELQDILEASGFCCLAAVAAVAEHSIFRNFASGRPDAEDAEQLVGFAEKIKDKINFSLGDMQDLKGRHGNYLSYNGVPFKPKAKNNCTNCGACAQKCPVGAINPQKANQTDSKKCISCMRCVAVCPHHARDFNPIVLKCAALAMRPVLSGHKSNYLYI